MLFKQVQIEPKDKDEDMDPYKKYEEYWPVIDETTGEIFCSHKFKLRARINNEKNAKENKRNQEMKKTDWLDKLRKTELYADNLGFPEYKPQHILIYSQIID